MKKEQSANVKKTFLQQVENVEMWLQRYEKQNSTRSCDPMTSRHEAATV